LIYSVRTRRDILYREELAQLADQHRSVTIALTRETPDGWSGHVGRVDRGLLSHAGWPPQEKPHCYVCGPTPFVEAIADTLVALGHDPADVKTERFGPTGGA
jgi:ferredoxin-NADP reductase